MALRISGWIRWLALAAVLGLLLLAAALFTLHRWLATEDFRGRVAREASAVLGVPVALGALEIDVWPAPALAVAGARAGIGDSTLTVGRVEVRPDWRAALSGQPAIATLVVKDAVLPAEGVDALLAGLHQVAQGPARDAKATDAPAGTVASGDAGMGGYARWLPRRTLLEGVTWVSAAGARTTLSADARISADGLPETATLHITAGAHQGVKASLARGQAAAPSVALWNLRIDIGGGTVQGPVRVQLPAPGARQLVVGGELQTRGVQVAALTAPSRPLSGQLEASTTFSASAPGLAALVDRLQSHTRFTVQDAELNGLDLLKAVETVGLSRGGVTRLDTLAGELHTQGRAAQLTQLVARSGVLSVQGNVTVSPARALGGLISVAVARGATGGLVGIPLQVGGTLDAPQVSLSRSALLGAAVGTALLPGVGTAAGAKLGDRVSRGIKGLFGR